MKYVIYVLVLVVVVTLFLFLEEPLVLRSRPLANREPVVLVDRVAIAGIPAGALGNLFLFVAGSSSFASANPGDDADRPLQQRLCVGRAYFLDAPAHGACHRTTTRGVRLAGGRARGGAA